MVFDIRIAHSDVRFAAQPGQTVLDAALAAGIEMPYSCRKGVCGSCAGQVTAGEVSCLPPGAAPPQGQHLLCQCSPVTDIEIAPQHWQRIDPAARRRFKVKVFRSTPLAADVTLLQLRLPAGQRAKFKAGQYLQVCLPDGSRRAFSMANPPHESDTLQLHVRHVAGGRFTEWLPALQPGMVLDVELPLGHFTVREGSVLPMVCVAGGTGFAPVKSLLDHLLKTGLRRSITLVWGARDRSGLYMLPAVQRWQRAWPDFRFVPAIEDAADAQALSAFEGRTDAALRSVFSEPGSLAGYEVYCCGSPAMVAATRSACIDERGLDPKLFFSDTFVPGPAPGVT